MTKYKIQQASKKMSWCGTQEVILDCRLIVDQQCAIPIWKEAKRYFIPASYNSLDTQKQHLDKDLKYEYQSH